MIKGSAEQNSRLKAAKLSQMPRFATFLLYNHLQYWKRHSLTSVNITKNNLAFAVKVMFFRSLSAACERCLYLFGWWGGVMGHGLASVLCAEWADVTRGIHKTLNRAKTQTHKYSFRLTPRRRLIPCQHYRQKTETRV